MSAAAGIQGRISLRGNSATWRSSATTLHAAVWSRFFARRSRSLFLTSSPIDYMCDHEGTSALVRDACFAAPARNYDTRDPHSAAPLPAIPHLYFMDPIGGEDREGTPVKADFYVDVASVFEKKKEMLACHRSQREWLLKHHGIDDYIAQMERWTRVIGRGAGLDLAEGFRRYRGHPYPQSSLLELLLEASARTVAVS